MCLAGRFTLEGTHWLTPLTYVYYPARLVHGFNVNVPNGYEIYLRNSGPVETDRVDDPALDQPYLVDSPDRACPDIIVSHCDRLIADAVRSTQGSVITLRENGRIREGAVIACLPAGRRLDLPVEESSDYAEVFLLAGLVETGGDGHRGERGHAFAAGPASLRLMAVQPAVLMVNYRGNGIVNAVARQAGALHRADNAYP